MSSRYVARRRSRWFQGAIRRTRAELTDLETGAVIVLVTEALATQAAEALATQDEGRLPPLPADASPFLRYESVAGRKGEVYLNEWDGSAYSSPVGRTMSAAFGERIAEVLNRASPKSLSDSEGPVTTRWF
jgi:hypothetical protein